MGCGVGGHVDSKLSKVEKQYVFHSVLLFFTNVSRGKCIIPYLFVLFDLRPRQFILVRRVDKACGKAWVNRSDGDSKLYKNHHNRFDKFV